MELTRNSSCLPKAHYCSWYLTQRLAKEPCWIRHQVRNYSFHGSVSEKMNEPLIWKLILLRIFEQAMIFTFHFYFTNFYVLSESVKIMNQSKMIRINSENWHKWQNLYKIFNFECSSRLRHWSVKSSLSQPQMNKQSKVSRLKSHKIKVMRLKN